MSKRPYTGKSVHQRKKAKAYHCAKERSGKKSQFGIQAGMRGILVMCARGREGRAVKEVMNVFPEYAEKFYPTVMQNDDNDAANGKEEEKDDDVEAAFAKEIADLKKPKSSKLFANIPTDMDCVLFIKVDKKIDTVDFVHRMLLDMKETNTKKTRFCSRFLPVQEITLANLDDIQKGAEKLAKPKFHTPDPDGNIPSRTFAILPRIRNCDKLKRGEVIETIASTVGRHHRVDLQDPELMIIAEICKNVCMMSIVPDFNKLKKYNIESILGLNQKDDQQQQQGEGEEDDDDDTREDETSIKSKEEEEAQDLS